KALPLLRPVVFVVAVIVVAAFADADLEEIRIREHRIRRRIATARMPPYADAVQVDPWIARAELSQRGDLVGERVVADVAIECIVECLRAPRRAQAVDRH